MIVCAVSTIAASEGVGEFDITPLTDPDNQAECCINLKGERGTVDLILFSLGGEYTVTIYGGDGPTATGDYTFTVPNGKGKCFPIPVGETVHKDGYIYFKVEGDAPLDDLLPLAIALRHCNTVTH